MRKLGMNLILFAAFIPAYANPVDCDFENDSCSWSIEGFRRVSTNQLNITDGFNDNMHRNDVNYAITEFQSTRGQSVLTSGCDVYPGEKCFSFKYQMKDFKRECIFIEVYSYDKIFWSLVWSSHSQHTLQGWNEINVTINVRKKSNIVIRFQNGNCFNVTYYISSISLKKQSCTETTTTFIRSPSTVIPMNCSKGATTSNKTTNNCTTTFVKLSSTDMATSSLATSVNTSSYYAKDGVIIGIVIGALAFIVAVLLIATYLYRRRAASSNANMSKYRTVSSVTYSGTTRPNTDNVETSQSIDRLDHTSANVSYNSQAVYSTVLKTQSRQSKPQQRCIKGTLNIYPRQTQLLNNDGNNVTNSEQTHNQYLQSADTDGTNSYDTVHNTDNHTTEFRDDTYDCTTIHPTTIPDPIYDHSNFKQNFDHVYDHSTPGSLSKDMRYLDHSCEITLQGSMQDVDPTYDHI